MNKDGERKSLFILEVERIVKAASKENEFRNNDTFYLKVENSPFIPLIIEAFNTPHGRRISIAHYVSINGDLAPDPEVVVTECGYPEALYQLCGTTEVLTYEDGKMRTSLSNATDVCEFLTMWGTNLRVQGFRDAAKKATLGKLAIAS